MRMLDNLVRQAFLSIFYMIMYKICFLKLHVVGIVYAACSFPRTWRQHEKHQVSFVQIVQIANLLLIHNLIVIGEIRGDL